MTARRPAPRFLQRRPRPLPDAASPETRAEADRVADHAVLLDEPEMVGPAIADEFGAHAEFIRAQQHAANLAPVLEVRAGLSLEARLADCVSRAKNLHVNATSALHVVRFGLDEARSKGRAPRPSVVSRLEALEAMLDAFV